MIDVNVPVRNDALVNIMTIFLNELTAENEFEFINQVQNAHFLSPMIFSGEIENNVMKKDSTISFKLLTNAASENYFMAFTDWNELGKWSSEKEETVILKYEDLKSMVLNDPNRISGFVINPYSHNIVITPEKINYINQRKSEVKIDKNTNVLLGEPSYYPNEMVEALISFFQLNNEIKCAYLFLAHYEGSEKSNLLLIIDSENEKEFFPQIGHMAQSFIEKDEYIDIMLLNTEFGRSSTQNRNPFYIRKC